MCQSRALPQNVSLKMLNLSELFFQVSIPFPVFGMAAGWRHTFAKNLQLHFDKQMNLKMFLCLRTSECSCSLSVAECFKACSLKHMEIQGLKGTGWNAWKRRNVCNSRDQETHQKQRSLFVSQENCTNLSVPMHESADRHMCCFAAVGFLPSRHTFSYPCLWPSSASCQVLALNPHAGSNSDAFFPNHRVTWGFVIG